MTRDVGGIRRAEHHHGSGGLVRLAGTGEGNSLAQGCPVPVETGASLTGNTNSNFLALDLDTLASLLGASEAGLDEAKGDSVAADAETSPLLGNGLGHAEDAHLGGGVVDLADIAVETAGGGDVDDAAVISLALGVHLLLGGIAEVGGGGADDAEGGGLVHGEHQIPLLVVHLVDHAVIGESSIVDDVVDLAIRPIEEEETKPRLNHLG